MLQKFQSNFLKLIIAIGISELAGIVGVLFTAPAIPSWYAGLVKPALNPLAWVFAPVWTALYALMGVAAFLVWSKAPPFVKTSEGKSDGQRKKIKVALGIFGAQLVLNSLWSIIFFGSTSLTINGLNNIGVALIEIIVLWLAILATIVAFYRISRPAAYLLLPYILWVSFAVYLNYSIWTLN